MKSIKRYGLLILGAILLIIGSSFDAPSYTAIGFLITLPALLIASRSSMLGYGKDMQLFNCIGTTLYGKSNYSSLDKTYVATKFFVFFLLPIYPIASYRVKNQGTTQKFFGVNTKYETHQVPLNMPQIIKIYFSTWGVAGIIIALIVLYY
jgi:hypothetical protein